MTQERSGRTNNEVVLRLRFSRRIVVLAVLAALVVLGAAATAVFAQADQIINGCFVTSGKKAGQFRILTGTSTTCKDSETALSWNKQGPPGPQGEQGPAGTAVGYAKVSAWGDGDVRPGEGKNVTGRQVAKRVDGSGNPQAGQFCFHDLTFSPRSAVASPDVPQGPSGADNPAIADRIVSVTVNPTVPGCPANTRAYAQVYDVSSAAFVDGDFYIWFED